MISRFVANSEKCRKYTFLGGPPRLLRYYIGGLSKFITILRWGGGGSRGTPNLYYVIYGRPLNRFLSRLLEAPRPPSSSRYPASGVGGGQHLVVGGQPDLQHVGQLTHHRDEEEEHGQVSFRVLVVIVV